ncbi:rhamnogalacturonan acetylesterase [Paractinoplanes lichenicola]|uniref:Rhamnogalacturonan acetylesterase n=1 Tax=Paractinoplanes lichenicola TaxID=2802976 RepID=A0ABS1VW31_9ACTN|nr:rhamnogalacturonan acetylesterase [Actinoplanes lichenicola]MBL7258643.1 rhamnogalacturonan acetylesterase [Actinoplanes lichenicola]
MSDHTSRRAFLAGAGAVGALAAVAPSLLTGPASAAAAAVKVYVAGDSTASTYGKSAAPRTGWGQALPVFFTSGVTVVNHAKSGASSKSFVDSGLLTPILNAITAGDLLLISFGHNDEKAEDPARYTIPATTYKTYLSRFVDGARAKGATPVLVTPVERRRFDSAGVAQSSHGAYPGAMKELAAARQVPCIDLTALSLVLWNKLGVNDTRKCFLFLAAGQSPNYPDGIEDNTHFRAHGAIEVARLVATQLKNQGLRPGGDFQRLTSNVADSLIVWP